MNEHYESWRFITRRRLCSSRHSRLSGSLPASLNLHTAYRTCISGCKRKKASSWQSIKGASLSAYSTSRLGIFKRHEHFTLRFVVDNEKPGLGEQTWAFCFEASRTLSLRALPSLGSCSPNGLPSTIPHLLFSPIHPP